MSWFHSSTAPVDARSHASPAEILACFQDQRQVLGKLAFLITGDQATAEQAIVAACDVTLRGNSPFHDWLFEWAKSATITSAISRRAAEIRLLGAGYNPRPCNHAEHLLQGHAEERTASLNRILRADGQKLVAELDPLCRAVLVLRVAIRSSIQDCVIRLNLPRAVVIAANCHAMTWLHNCETTPMEAIGPLPLSCHSANTESGSE